MLKVSLLSVTVAIVVVFSAWTSAAEMGLVNLSLNSKEFSVSEGELSFLPGRSNVLEFQPNWQCMGDHELEAVVTKVLPNGTRNILSALITPPDKHSFDLGPMTAPAVYEFEAGVMYRRGYRLEVSLKDAATDRILYSIAFYQGLAIEPKPWSFKQKLQIKPGDDKNLIKAGKERFVAGTKERIVYNPLYGVDSAIALRLSDSILLDQDDLRVLYQLNIGACVEQLPCELRIAASDGKQLVRKQVILKQEKEWTSKKIDCRSWPAGAYRISLSPILNGKVWNEGPSVIYRKKMRNPREILVSRFCPWTLQRDPKRQEILINDFEQACQKWAVKKDHGWDFACENDTKPLFCPSGTTPDIMELKLPSKGYYAIYAKPYADGCLIRAGKDELIRPLLGVAGIVGLSFQATENETFICATDMSNNRLQIFAFDQSNIKPKSGLARIRLIPVTKESVETFYHETSNPPTPLYGINDWCEFFRLASRLKPDQFDTIIGGLAELGLRNIDWSIGRSWIEYHSELPNTTRFPCVPLKEAAKMDLRAMEYLNRSIMINEYKPLQTVYENRRRFGTQIRPWLSMNRHYGVNTRGGIFASRFYRDNPQWYRGFKSEKQLHDAGAMSYFFNEVRQERIDIFLEVARKGADGILVGCCRQVPMLLYNPQMVAAYQKETGVDPRTIDGSNFDQYTKWITWRADHFTQFLRDLKKGLTPIRNQSNRRIPIAVRIPSAGFLYNLAQGLDVRQWLREGLVDQLHLDPLDDLSGRGSHDVRPYIEMGQQYGVPIIGGIGGSWAWSPEGYVTTLSRALGLLESGVDGIEIFETEVQAKCNEYRWLLPVFGNAEKIRNFLAESNLESCYPISAENAMIGHDNHSKWMPSGDNWTIYGYGRKSL